MEHKAKTIVSTSIGDVEVRALVFKDLDRISGDLAEAMFGWASASDQGDSMIGMIAATSTKVLKKLFEICTSAKSQEIDNMELSDIITVLDKWMEVSRWEEVAPTFLRIAQRMSMEKLKSMKEKAMRRRT